MKVPETKTTSSNLQMETQQEAQPFFQKEGGGNLYSEYTPSFFSGPPAENSKPFFKSTPPRIQTKLTIGQPGDKYEQEADAMADKVIQRLSQNGTNTIQKKCAACEQEDRENTLTPKIQRKAIFESNEEQPPPNKIQRKCAACQEEEIQPKRVQLMENPHSQILQRTMEEEPEVQMKNEPEPTQTSGDLESRLNSSKGGGTPLSEDTRTSMESSFGADFSGVRIHTGSNSVQMSQELGAQAFTHGSDIHFNSGKYDTSSSGGQKLLAHELTHVVQQGGGVKPQEEGIQRTSIDNNILQLKGEGQFNPEKQADKIHEATDQWGTDERVIFDALWTGSATMSKKVEEAYNRKYEPSLKEELKDELEGIELFRALALLKYGKLGLIAKVREVIYYAKVNGRLNFEKLFHAFDEASNNEIAELKSVFDVSWLGGLANESDIKLINAYLDGKKEEIQRLRIIAAKIERAINVAWGTDEDEIWRAVESASKDERKKLADPFGPYFMLLEGVKNDLSDGEWIRFQRLLEGKFGNVEKIEIAAEGWGTEDADLMVALESISQEEYEALKAGTTTDGITLAPETKIKNVSALKTLLIEELSGEDLEKALQILHFKQFQFDGDYQREYLKKKTEDLVKKSPDALEDEGVSVIFSDVDGGSNMTIIGRLKVAIAGAGTDEDAIWKVLNKLTFAQRSFIDKYNPEGVMDLLEKDLSSSEFEKVKTYLKGNADSITEGIKEALDDSWGTDKNMLYFAVERAVSEGIGPQVLQDKSLNSKVKLQLDPDQYLLYKEVLTNNSFSPKQRLQWATTARIGTDEDLVFKLCEKYGEKWMNDNPLDPSVDRKQYIDVEVYSILYGELSTRDLWTAIDKMRPGPKNEEEKLVRAKEMLERERSGAVSRVLMDTFSYKGENAEDAWREYQATYNQAMEDGELDEEEKKALQEDEAYSQKMTKEYQEAKATIAQWVSSIAVAIVAVVATILTGGGAGPLLAVLAANVKTIAISMVTAAALKVGLKKAIEGEGYDLTSAEALVDAVSASVEVGLSVVGGQLAGRFMQGLGKLKMMQSVVPVVQSSLGKAGTRIVGAGLEGMIDASIGSLGEGVIQGLANEETWANGILGFFENMGKNVGLNVAIGGPTGFLSGSGVKSMGEFFGPRIKLDVPNEIPKPKIIDGDNIPAIKKYDELLENAQNRIKNKYKDQAPEVIGELKKIGPVNEGTLNRLIDDWKLRKALLDNPEVIDILKKCTSDCFGNATPQQIGRYGAFIKKLNRLGVKYDKATLREYIRSYFDDLDIALKKLDDPNPNILKKNIESKLGNYKQTKFANYGETDLSKRAIKNRESLKSAKGRKVAGTGQQKKNYAVVEYKDNNGNLQYFESFSEGKFPNFSPQNHSEQILLRELEAAGIDPKSVTRIYSEIAPCISCSPKLQEALSEGVIVEYSFPWTENGIKKWKKSIDDIFKK